MKKILIFVDDLYEELELWYPKLRLEEAGYTCVIAGPEAEKVYLGKHGYPCSSQLEFGEAEAVDFEALVIPGGYAPDKLRRYHKVLDITREFHEEKKPIAFICHGGWVPISAKILKGKTVTSFIAIKDDIENAGAKWVDKEVVVDGHLISSRTPRDLPCFTQEIIRALSKR